VANYEYILSVYVLQFYYDDQEIYIPHRFVFMLWAGTSISTIFYAPPHWYRSAIVSVGRKNGGGENGPWGTINIHIVSFVIVV
jgi:hypothetical protein